MKTILPIFLVLFAVTVTVTGRECYKCMWNSNGTVGSQNDCRGKPAKKYLSVCPSSFVCSKQSFNQNNNETLSRDCVPKTTNTPLRCTDIPNLGTICYCDKDKCNGSLNIRSQLFVAVIPVVFSLYLYSI